MDAARHDRQRGRRKEETSSHDPYSIRAGPPDPTHPIHPTHLTYPTYPTYLAYPTFSVFPRRMIHQMTAQNTTATARNVAPKSHSVV
jgi:hypothetical protein